jgi:magnesium transporter
MEDYSMITYLKNEKGLAVTEKWEPNCWINVQKPTPKEQNYIINDLQIPEAFYNDIEDTDERPRIEVENGWTLCVMRLPYRNEDEKLPFITVPMGVVFKDEVFVSICFYKVEMISDFIKYSKRKNVIKKNDFDFVLRLMLSSSVWFLKYLKQINQNTKEAENQLEKSIRNEDLQALLRLEKCLVYFTTSLKGNDILSHRIKNLREIKDKLDGDLVEDVDIELRQALETTNIYSDILSGMMDAYASVISNNLNVIMKQLTSISIILMIPTLIASFYGMNVHNSLEETRFGFWVVALISFSISAFGVFMFKKRNWF